MYLLTEYFPKKPFDGTRNPVIEGGGKKVDTYGNSFCCKIVKLDEKDEMNFFDKKFGVFSNCCMITRVSAYINFFQLKIFLKQQIRIVNMKCSYMQIISQTSHEYLPV